MKISPIIEINELFQIYKNEDVMIFDASNNKNAKANYESEHLEGAFFIDLNTQLIDPQKTNIADGGRHPLPQLKTFIQTLASLGISKSKHIVIYDDQNCSNAAARFWWMLKSIDHEKVQVLNGGLKNAKKNNFPINSNTEIIIRHCEDYKDYKVDNWMLPTISIHELELILNNPNYKIIDVRNQDRYEGLTEPIDLIAGHIPGAINIPFIENLDENGLLLNPKKLRDKYLPLFEDIDSNNLIVHCGSGVTACHTLLAMDYAEIEIPKLYVGSWSEWSRNNKIIEKTDTQHEYYHKKNL